MEQLQSLLDKLSKEVSRENTKLEEKKSRGESFNIFSICGVNHYEVTHSAIIAEFLDPLGSHGQGLAFVKAFVESLNLQDFDFSLNGVEVTTEMVIRNGRIDIVISNGNKQAIIIENKIYAADQCKQLKRYDDFAKTKYTNGYKILYLTLNGNDPNDDESRNVEYITISYKHHIVDWLLKCKHLAIDKPLIRETLNQYIQHIKNLTNTIDMENNEKNSIIELLIKYPQETAKIINTQWDMEEYIVKTYLFPTLERVAQKFDMRFYCEDTNRLFSRSSSAYFAMIPNKSTSWHIAFEFAKGSWRDLEVGLVWNKDLREVRRSIKLLTPIFDKGPNNIWFYGWKYVNHPSWDTAYLLEVANNPKEFEAEYEELINDILKFINLDELQ
ncbi:MAG: PD-(D/E)XK nuclease family protein [Alistipes sp.]|nr:PD-(D/E)XK nuclease family protein [Alistipes sp.]